MADSSTVSEALNVTLNNDTVKNVTEATGRAAATPHGLLIAYSSLVIMALLPIFFGAFRSVGHKKRQKVCLFRSRNRKLLCKTGKFICSSKSIVVKYVFIDLIRKETIYWSFNHRFKTYERRSERTN